MSALSPQQIDDILSGRRRDWRARLIRFGTALAEPMYGIGQALHRASYHIGWKRAYGFDVPIISIGNLTTGGTGKTPFTAKLVSMLQQAGFKPGIASRGYKSLEADEKQGSGNDEKRVLEILCPGVPHIQQRDRVTAVRELIDRGVDCVLLDDGFQHWRLRRAIDIVLIDAVNPFGYGHLLPRGLLREPLAGLKRADAIVITRVDQAASEELTGIRNQIQRYTSSPLMEVCFRPTGWLDQTGKQFSLDRFSPRAHAFCGIGNPKGFRKTLQDLGFEVDEAHWHPFPDHYHYTHQEFEELSAAAGRENTPLLTTLKDLVKIRELLGDSQQCYALMIEADILSGEPLLHELISQGGRK